MSSRPVVVFTDDDCRPQPGWLDVLEAAFDAPDIGFVIGQVRADVENAYLPFDAVAAPTPRPSRASPIPIDLGHGACMAFRREAYLGCGGADDRMGAGSRLLSAEDHDLFLRLLVTGWKGKYEPGGARCCIATGVRTAKSCSTAGASGSGRARWSAR